MTTGALRALGVVRLVVGLAWGSALARDRRVAGACLPLPGRVAAGVLAGRDVAQGAMLVFRPDPDLVILGAAMDVSHATSMLPVAVVSARYRRPALLSAAAALAWVAGATAGVRRRRG